MTAAEFDAVLGVIQTIAIILVALVIVWALWWALWGQHQRRKPEPVDLEVYRNIHDWNCDAGAWPHEGRCIPAAERSFTSWVELAHCEYVGLGNSIRVPEDDYCTGAGE